MRRLKGIVGVGCALGALAMAAAAPAAHEKQIEPDIGKLEYSPVGHFKPGDALPAANDLGALTARMTGRRFNPSGKYNAFDTNVFEVMMLPYRAAGDSKADDPYGNGGNPEHGLCQIKPNTARKGNFARLAGECPNHQLEYLDYYETTMRDILGDFGVTTHRYAFESPGSSNTQAGTAYNVAAVVPGAEHPGESVLISGHYDQTDDGPASAWDSAEGHAQVIRVAKLMADYWKATGTRPAVTVKFVPWDAEESGTLGSADYVDNVVVPGQADKVRSYWNTDPCAGGYPAFRFGNAADRVDLGIQLANIRPGEDPLPGEDTHPPASAEQRFATFNEKAPTLVEQVFDHLDDKITLAPGVEREIFVSTTEGAGSLFGGDINKDVFIGTSRPILFSSDWRNFERIGVPFFNPGPEITGPGSQGELGNPDALAVLHSPLDNLQFMNAYTGGQKDGKAFSEAWIKGMEMCAHLLAWGMLQPEHAGATPLNRKVVAYYEALPNEASRGEAIRFDASGSHRSDDGHATSEDLQYVWDFGDGTKATGKVVRHRYARKGIYQSKLTVRSRRGGAVDSMRVPITVVRGRPQQSPRLAALPAEDADGDFKLTWTFNSERVERYLVEEGTGIQRLFTDDAEDLGNWIAEPPTEASIRPWQASDSSTRKIRGNLRRSGERSFWTGVATEDQRPGVGPGDGVSALTLKTPLAVPEGRSTILSFWSDFANDRNDVARVEVAADQGPGQPLEWETIEAFGRGSEDRYTLTFTETPTAEGGPNFERRTVDLTGFAGERVYLRFSYVLGPSQFVNVWRTGWYIDDISVESAHFAEIASVTGKTFAVEGRPAGEYLYRVRAEFKDASTSGASNIERTRVTG